jgi:hypothetical protein
MPAGVVGLAKTGLRPVPRPSLRGGVARGFAGLGEPVGLSSLVGVCATGS